MAQDNALLAQVRHSIRALNGAIEAGSKHAGLTVQQQSFLLSVAGNGGRRVPLAAVRRDVGMDQATTSELLARLGRLGLVSVSAGRDRRAVEVTLTPKGQATFRRSITGIRRAIRAANDRGELDALRRNLEAYLDFYTRARGGRRR